MRLLEKRKEFEKNKREAERKAGREADEVERAQRAMDRRHVGVLDAAFEGAQNAKQKEQNNWGSMALSSAASGLASGPPSAPSVSAHGGGLPNLQWGASNNSLGSN